MKLLITEQGKPAILAGVVMTLQINAIYEALCSEPPYEFEDGRIDKFFWAPNITDEYMMFGVEAGLFVRGGRSWTHYYKFTPLGKRLWGSYLLLKSTTE